VPRRAFAKAIISLRVPNSQHLAPSQLVLVRLNSVAHSSSQRVRCEIGSFVPPWEKMPIGQESFSVKRGLGH